MSTRPKSSVVYLPPVSDKTFLREMAKILERLRKETDARGHPLLASLLAIAKGEAEDAVMTCEQDIKLGLPAPEGDDSITVMAKKFAYRANVARSFADSGL